MLNVRSIKLFVKVDGGKKMIDYAGIVKDMVDNSSTKSATSIEYNGKWYGIEIKLHKDI